MKAEIPTRHALQVKLTAAKKVLARRNKELTEVKAELAKLRGSALRVRCLACGETAEMDLSDLESRR